MTVGIGMIASSGIVIAADSQITTDVLKSWHGKISGVITRDVDPRPDGTVIFSHQGGFAVTMAGQPIAYAIEAGERLIQVFDTHKAKPLDELRWALEHSLRSFQDEYVTPYLCLPIAERPYIQLMMAASLDGREALWYSENSLITKAEPYHVIGSGQSQADHLLRQVGHVPKFDLAHTVLLAAFIVHQVKEVNLYCGKTTDIMCVRHGHMFQIGRHITKQIDDVYDDHADTLAASGLWSTLGLLSATDKKSVQKARRELKKLLKIIRRDCLFEKEPKRADK